MERLIVKNFGPLKDIDIELNKVNLFIGENGSGKSVLGKLITILFDLTELNEEGFHKKLRDFRINFLQNDTEIKFIFGYFEFHYFNEKINVDDFFYNTYQIVKKLENKNKNIKNSFIRQSLINVKKMKSSYIPSERNFVSIISQSLSSFVVADIPLPKYLLQFSSDFENAANEIIVLDFLNIQYINGEGLDRHKVYFDDKNYLPLNESSSGIQAVIPLLITYTYFTEKYNTIVIEEPEQNLFPKAQKEVVDFLIENLQIDNKLFLMTHSPYILTALNNLILANDVKEAKGEDIIKGLVKASQCIPFEKVNAYYIKDGKAVNIMDKENRLIGVNVIDEISDEVNETFDLLLSKLD